MVPRQSAGQQAHARQHHPSSTTWLAPPSREDSPHSKVSLTRSTHSNEADDERSSFSSDGDSGDWERGYRMGPEGRRGGYPGEDTRLTSRTELAGFYAYGWAAEVFVVCGMGAFIPITLEQLARERGVLQSDHRTPCSSNFEIPDPPFNATTIFTKPKRTEQCVVRIGGYEVNTASFAMYTFSVSVLLQTLLILSMSGAADHGQYRKTLLVTFAVIGAVATMLFLPVTPDVFLLGAVFAIIANTCYGASAVLLNSFLPLLVRYHPETQYPGPEDTEEDGSAVQEEDEEAGGSPNARLLGSSAADNHTAHPRGRATTGQELSLSTRISANGMAIGYVAAVTVQTTCIVLILLLRESSNFALRLALFIVGAWWLLFTVPAALWLRPRPGPPLQLTEDKSKAGTWLAYFAHSWRSLGRTIMHARRLRDLLIFLAAWCLLSDGIATVSGTATLFAKTTLGMEAAALALINIIVVISGILGAFAWSRLSLYMGLQPSHTILTCICVLELIPLYGLLGYIPAVRRWGVLGLQQQWELYPLGAVYGFVLGGLSSYCRAFFGELIPEGFEAAFYALFAITDKGSSIFGPAIVGAIIDRTGEVRPAFVFLAILIGLPIPLMALVDVDRGRREGLALAQKLNDAGGVASRGYGTLGTAARRRSGARYEDRFETDDVG